MRHLTEAPALRRPVVCSGSAPVEGGELRVDVALDWDRGGRGVTRSFVNLLPTSCGGAHVDELLEALDLLPSTRRARFDPREGLVAVVSVLHPGAVLKGSSDVSLESEGVREVVRDVVERELGRAERSELRDLLDG